MNLEKIYTEFEMQERVEQARKEERKKIYQEIAKVLKEGKKDGSK